MKSVGAAVTKPRWPRTRTCTWPPVTYDGKVSFLNNDGDVGVYGGYDPQTLAALRSERDDPPGAGPGRRRREFPTSPSSS